jgi:SIR2-like domain
VGENMNKNYERAIQACLEGNAVLMTGAGFSYDAKNYKGEILGVANDLIKFLCENYQIPYNPQYSLDEVATHILEQAKQNDNYSISQSLIKILQDHYQTSSKSVTDEQKVIANIPWIRIYTTNYDDVFENAYNDVTGKYIPTFNAYDDTSKVAKEKSIVHLNGYIRNLTVEKLSSEFKLTSFSYWQEEFKRNKMFELLKQDLDNANAIIYIGTSLKYDFDISKILNIDDYKSKTIFIDRMNEEFDISDSRKSYLGTQIKKGVKGFATDLETAKKEYVPNQKKSDWYCFKPIKLEKNIYEENNLQYLWDLLVLGKLNNNILQKNLFNDDYIISRDELSSINPREYKVINIHSNLGNGKTTSILKEAYKWSRDNSVFFLRKVNDNISRDLTEISKIKGHKILIIEDYSFYQAVLKKIKIYLDGSFTVFLTSRSFVNEQFEKQIPLLLNIEEKEIKHINLNFLSKGEIKKISDLLHKLQLRKIIKENNSQVRKIINKNKQLSNILLDLLKSETISKKIDDIFEKIESNYKALQLLCATMVNNFTTLRLDHSDLFSLVEVTTSDVESIRNEDIKEILNIGHGELTLQSTVFAKYLVSKKSLDKKLIDTMKKILMNAIILSREEEKRVCEILISQSNIRVVFSGLESSSDNNNVGANVVRYFDDIVECRNHKGNIFFWLQYGMACMDIKEYERSDNYLNISYDLAEQRSKNGKKFETFQIDTQYARLILEKNIYQGENSKGKFEDFYEANNKLERAIKQKPTQARLAYKQMALYKPYINKNIKYYSGDEMKKAENIINNHLKKKWFISGKKENTEVKIILEECHKDIIKFVVKR